MKQQNKVKLIIMLLDESLDVNWIVLKVVRNLSWYMRSPEGFSKNVLLQKWRKKSRVTEGNGQMKFVIKQFKMIFFLPRMTNAF